MKSLLQIRTCKPKNQISSFQYFKICPSYKKLLRMNFITRLSVIIILLIRPTQIDAQWTQLNIGQPGEVRVVAAIGGNVFAGTSAGIYRSSDKGKNWTNVSSYYALCFSVKGSEIFAGTYLNGVVSSTDDGITWNITDTSLHREIDAITVNGNYIFAGGGAVMLRSSNNGSSWEVIQNGLQYGQTTVTGFAVTEGKILASTFAGVVVSTDNGNNWSGLVGTNSTNQVTGCIAVIDSTVLVGWEGGIIRSTDDGRSWYYPSSWIKTSITYSIIGDSSRIYAGTDSGVHLSTDGGVIWSPLNSGLPGGQAWPIAAQDTNLFAGTNQGIYISSDKGINWIPSGSGIIGSSVNSITGDGPMVIAAFNLNSIFESTDYGRTREQGTNLPNAVIYNVGAYGSNSFALTDSGIYQSSDNGKTWDHVNTNIMGPGPPRALTKSGS